MKSQVAFPFLYWIARIGSVLAIGFIGMFALDSFENSLPLSDQIVHLGMHLIPVLVLFFVFLLACFWERVGGIFYILIGLGLAPGIYLNNYALNHSVWISLGIIAVINLPFFLVGLVFFRRGVLRAKSK
jgi:hypothetical protein